MSSVPIDPGSGPPSVEGLLNRVRDGVRAEKELLEHYWKVYGREGSIPLAALQALHRIEAEKWGIHIFDVINTFVSDRLEEAKERLEVLGTREGYEKWFEQNVGRVLRRLLQSQRRAPRSASDFLEDKDGKGYQPTSGGELHSSIMMRIYDPRFESVIDKVQGKNVDQQRLHRVLTRLHFLKGWTFQDLACLVFGPGQDEDVLKKQADCISHWVRPASRHVRDKKRGRQARRRPERRSPSRDGDAPESPDLGKATEEDPM